MKRLSVLGRGVAAALAAGLTLVMVSGAAPASAEQIGSLTFNSLTAQDVGFTVTTSGGCPTSPTNATNFQIRITNDSSVSGNSAPTVSANITGNTAGATVSGGITAAFTATASATLEQFSSNNGLGAQLPAGTYRVDLICRTVLSSTSLGEFSGRIVIGSGGAVVSATPIVPVVAVDTTTTLTVAGTAGWGQQLALSASVTAGAGTPTGTVDFKDGATTIASAPVKASGVASTSYGLLGLGDHSITAVYVPAAGALFNTSTSAASTVTVSLQAPTLIAPAKLSGSVKVGGTVVCLPGTWSGATQYTYEFLKNGVVAQTSTTDVDIKVAPSDLGKALSCRVTGVNPIGDGSPSTTAAVKVAAGSAAVATKAPRILYSGSAANVGETLKAYKGVWSPSATYTYNYIWKRGSTVIKQGSTATSYKATATDKGKKLTLTVQVKRTGYTTATKTSAAVTVK
ncbi:MAG: Ig-like domain-containing protein [Candidatus Nanopelagicales bacterium]